MNLKLTVYKLLSSLLVIVLLAGTTGITIISHHCNMSGNHSVSAGLFIHLSDSSSDCCKSAGNNCEDHSGKVSKTPCCNYKIQQVKISGFQIKFDNTKVLIAEELFQAPSFFKVSGNSHEVSSILQIQNKSGGRQIITFDCQLKS